MTTDTTEKGLETLIVEAMTGKPAPSPAQTDIGREPSAALYGGTGWNSGDGRTTIASTLWIWFN